ncbi:MAG: DNA polymerase III subunit delta [Clostridiales bacterium]|nr:DNA polymerase III subunit delta [Clostridiales bacterium]
MDLDNFEQQIKKNALKGCYILYGPDENLIKDAISKAVDSVVEDTFRDLNLVKFDGMKVQFEDVMNACETLPFMSEKKVVIVFRADFLGARDDRESKKKVEDFYDYLSTLPPYTILIMYYVFGDDREKASNNIKKLDKLATLVQVDKLKGNRLYKKVADIFEERHRSISKVLLQFFCDNVENNMEIINNEINKLLDYTEGREITKQDIIDLLPQTNNEDIFDLVDFVSQRKPEKAINILNELLFKGESVTGVLFMIERQFKLLYSIKLGLEEGKNKDILTRELKLHPYVCEKLINQSRKFSLNQLRACMKMCLDTEKALKSSQSDKKIEMEMLLINSVMI